MRWIPLRTLAAAGAGLLCTSCYVVTQGASLVRYQVRATPVERVAATPDGELERFFERVAAVRTFAQSDLGLAASDNYTTFVEVERDYLVDVVSAVRELSFERKTWWFPVVGSVPYRGYYRRAAADRLARSLREEGWDVIIRRVDGFSTLGYFRDPLFSFMRDYDEWRIAELIIHEMAHATLWLRGQSQFNEEFATFVGRAGARAYLEQRYGAGDVVVAEFDDYRHDAERFRDDILRLRDELEVLYLSAAAEDRPPAETAAAKAETISRLQARFAATYDERYRSERYRWFSDATINNAYIDLFVKYSDNIEQFEAVYQAHGSLALTIEAIVSGAEQWRRLPRRDRTDPYRILRSAAS